MRDFFIGFLKLFIRLGILLLQAAWSLTGLLLYVLPAFLAAIWLGDKKSGAGIFLIILIATGLLSLRWKPLSQIYDVFHLGNMVISRSTERMLAEIDNPKFPDDTQRP